MVLAVLEGTALCSFGLEKDISNTTIQLGDHWQLFLDNYIVARSTGFDRVVHHPQPKGLVIPADKPWETAGTELLHEPPPVPLLV